MGGYRERLDHLNEEKSLSYDRFDEHGEEFIDVMTDGVSELENEVWVSADEILEASGEEKRVFNEAYGNRIFTSIYNLLCDAEVLHAFHDSPTYEIQPSEYSEEDVIEAWEYVSGEEYGEEEEVDNLEDKPPEKVENLYHELKD
jgi:hypothetical protein